jgi:hypothetical protein
MMEKLRREDFGDLFLATYCEGDNIRENEMNRGGI